MASDDSRSASGISGSRFLVVGGGIAGVTCAERVTSHRSPLSARAHLSAQAPRSNFPPLSVNVPYYCTWGWELPGWFIELQSEEVNARTVSGLLCTPYLLLFFKKEGGSFAPQKLSSR